jgi:hypothetical protein
MGKNIALFIDGTGNVGLRDEPHSKASNVFKLYRSCQEKCRHYQPGVGGQRADVLGQAAGFGTKERLREAYRFLTDNYRSGDNIYLFGFSRGAFAVRLLAGFLGHVGSLFGRPPFDAYLPHVYQIYESSVVLDVVKDFERYLLKFSDDASPIPIHFIGVWDTVERYFPQRDLPEIERLAAHINHARHALAIHERRNEMEPVLWTEWIDKPAAHQVLQTVKQVWFPGAHSDVGGGYPESKLSEAPGAWIGKEAAALGLKLKSLNAVAQKPIIHQQRTGGRLLGAIASVFEGESVRVALSPPTPKVLGSMDFNQTAEAHFSHPIGDIEFHGYILRSSRKKAKAELLKVDDAARKLLKSLPARNKPPIP